MPFIEVENKKHQNSYSELFCCNYLLISFRLAFYFTLFNTKFARVLILGKT